MQTIVVKVIILEKTIKKYIIRSKPIDVQYDNKINPTKDNQIYPSFISKKVIIHD